MTYFGEKRLPVELITDLTRYHSALKIGARGCLTSGHTGTDRSAMVQFDDGGPYIEIYFTGLKILTEEKA